MADYTDDFRRILDEELGNYSGRVLEILAAAIQKKGLVLSSDLLKSLQTQVLQASANQIAGMQVEFNQYGRIREMKYVNTTSNQAPIEELERFVRKRGVSNFQRVPGYGDSRAPVTESAAVNRIAWGIARARLRDQSHPKPKAWFNKTFYGSLNRFIDAVATRYAAQTGTHLAATIQI
ncbi:MAG TPA: hypothetical protein VF598_03935 [Hymenobacter sp.]|jgi:hypothetical protein